MASLTQTTNPGIPPPPVCFVSTTRSRTVLVVVVVPVYLPPMTLSPGDCVVCGQEAVAFDPHGLGWCSAHAPLELLCP
jgi:hypothetical protein